MARVTVTADLRKALIPFLLLAVFIFPSLAQAVGTVGVKPMLIDLNLAPGKKIEFQIEVYSTSKDDAPVHASLFDAMQKEDGSMDFVDAGNNPYSCAPWVKLEKTDFLVRGGETVKLKGEITVPMANSGSRIAAVMIEPGYEKKKTGISVKVRYAAVLRLKISGRPVTEQAKLEKVGIRKMPDNTPAIEAVIANSSETDFMASGRALLQDSAGKIVASINLTTPALENKKAQKEKEKKRDRFREKTRDDEEQRLYPGAKVAFFGRIDRPVPPGEYIVMLTMKYGKRTLSLKEKITLTAEDLAASAKKPSDAPFELKPERIELKGQPGGARTASFSIMNISDKPLTVKVSPSDLAYNADGDAAAKEKGSTPYSATAWVAMEKTEYAIGPRQSQTVLLKLSVPQNTQPGNWYSALAIEAQGSTAKELVEVSVLIPGKTDPSCTADGLERTAGKDRAGFGVMVKNSSPIALAPKARVVIRDANNNEVESIELKLKAKELLPRTEARMAGEGRKKLVPGSYTAIAEVEYGGKEKAQTKKAFTVK
ncbi:MAG: hypothetical protein WC291_12170 [Thermodesulfovibrionales bacterium]